MNELDLNIDRLKTGEYTDFSLIAPPSIMEAEDKEAIFQSNILISGEAILANDHMVLNICIKTNMQNFCKICNEPISHEILVEEKHVPFPLNTMQSGVFCLEPYIRELLFLNIPRYSECGGSCPERASIKKYLKQSDDPQEG
jgi:hypothetical protein